MKRLLYGRPERVLEGVEDFSRSYREGMQGLFRITRSWFGQVILPFRIALTGSGGGPSMFVFAEFLGKEATIARLEKGVETVTSIKKELKGWKN